VTDYCGPLLSANNRNPVAIHSRRAGRDPIRRRNIRRANNRDPVAIHRQRAGRDPSPGKRILCATGSTSKSLRFARSLQALSGENG
jgi:hypothetical protein